MIVDVIDTLEGFDRLKSNWDSVYAADPDAHILFSWTWFSIYFRKFNYDWLILAARPSAAHDYVAFWPIKSVTMPRDNGEFYDEIWMGGMPRADFSGFLCRPEYEEQVLPALSERLKKMHWTRLLLEFVRTSERRMRLLMKPFPQSKFAIESVEHIIDGTNNNICPFVHLPDNWDAYLNDRLSANTRQKARRFLKKVDEHAEFRVTHADGSELEGRLETLLGFWQAKWGNRYGARTEQFVSAQRKLLPPLFEAGLVVMPIFWKEEKPLAFMVLLKDDGKRYLSYSLAARDESFNSPPPGFILHAHSIRWAIRNGFRTYDFMLGNHPFKYMFGCEENRLLARYVTHKGRQPVKSQIDSRSIPYVLDMVRERLAAGKIAEAERACRQVLAIEPEQPRALFLLAQLCERQSDFAGAKSLLQKLLALEPANHAVWLRLGKILGTLGDKTGAAESFRKVQELDPGNSEVPGLLAAVSPQQDLLRSVTAKRPNWLPD